MSHETKTTASAVRSGSNSGAGLYIILTLTAALTSLLLTLPPWAMFMGWVAYFTRRPSAAEGFQSWVCTVLGLCVGAAAVLAVPLLAPTLGSVAFPVVVLCVALTVISTRGLPVLSNLLGYFLGLITFFAAHLEPELSFFNREARKRYRNRLNRRMGGSDGGEEDPEHCRDLVKPDTEGNTRRRP